MKIKLFWQELSKLLEIDINFLEHNQNISQLAGWDSLTIVSTIALIDECFDMVISGQEIEGCETLTDLIKLIGDKSGRPIS